ncbi:MmcQ/YjbR family DNA-binding protein [Microbacterium tumbae]
MATVEDAREIALALPGVEERAGGHTGEPSWRLGSGQIAWIRGPSTTDLGQLAELGRSWPRGPVLGVRVTSIAEKEALLAAEPERLFTIPHFDGYPAVLVILDAVDSGRLAEILSDAWLARAPARLAREWLAERGLE